jgi:acyl-coenzyme A synthetase/AMP-(fatty) acid ligase
MCAASTGPAAGEQQTSDWQVPARAPAVEDAAVTGAADDDLGERVVAWIVLRDGASAQESELIDDVAGHLARTSAAVRFLDELPRNDMAKVQKQRPGA